jgi:glutamyl-tRNA(Gln) amidotransferase subunit E
MGIPGEVRGVNQDNTTSYQRPIPGAARMYPETDVPPIRITKEKYQNILDNLPELLENKQKRIGKEFNISAEQAKQLIITNRSEMFELICKEIKNTKLVAQTLLNTMLELENTGINTNVITPEQLIELFQMLEADKFAKEAIPRILEVILIEHLSLSEAIEKLGLTGLGREKVESIIEGILNEPENKANIDEKGMNAFGPLMGIAMGKLRGKADGKLVNEILREKITEMVNKS